MRKFAVLGWSTETGTSFLVAVNGAQLFTEKDAKRERDYFARKFPENTYQVVKLVKL